MKLPALLARLLPARGAAPAAVTAAPAPARGDTTADALQRVLVPAALPNWTQWLARDYTPERIELTLRGALAGNHVEQWELFHLMEDTWPRLAKNLAELKRAVAQMDWQVEAWAEDGEAPEPEAELRAKALSRALWTMRPRPDTAENGFTATLHDLLDAWAKGTVVLEVDWELRRDRALGRLLMPRATRWVEPRAWAWGPAGALRLRADALRGAPRTTAPGPRATELLPFPEHKFLLGVCRARTAHPLAGALLRPLAWWWCCANFSGAWLLNLAQVFGLPLRWATYDPSRPGLLNEIAEMMENLGSAGWGVFPQGTQLELKEGTKTGGSTPQDSLLDRAERQCDLLILGQTLTTDVASTGSQALGAVHKTVRDEVVQAAAEWAADVLMQQLVPSFCRLNWGDDDLCPQLVPQRREKEDLKTKADTLEVLSRVGMQIPRDWAHEQFAVPLPAEGEAVLERAAPAMMMPGAPDGAGPQESAGSNEDEDEDEDEQEDGKAPVTAAAPKDALARTVAERVTGVQAEWLGGAVPWFRRLIEAAESPHVTDAEFEALITRAARHVPDELAPLLRTEAVAEALEHAMGAAMVNGAVRGWLKRGRPA